MPLSKRDKKVDLTKVQKKTSKKKTVQVAKIQQCLKSFAYIYVLKFQNPSNEKLVALRTSLHDCQLVFGKNKVSSLALGHIANEGHKHKTPELSKYIKGQCSLLFSNCESEEMQRRLESLRCPDFARPGLRAHTKVIFAAGAAPKFGHTMEPYLRNLGLPVKLVRGVIHLTKEYTICKADDMLTPEQCRILKLLDIQLSEYRVLVIAVWNSETGVTELALDAADEVEKDAKTLRVTCQKLEDDLYHFVSEM